MASPADSARPWGVMDLGRGERGETTPSPPSASATKGVRDEGASRKKRARRRGSVSYTHLRAHETEADR
eukprot:3084937-Rhodomonas_salina.2